jgi:hypothetical protein
MDIADEIRLHLTTLAPHVSGRKSSQLLRKSLNEIERMRGNRNTGHEWLYEWLYEKLKNITEDMDPDTMGAEKARDTLRYIAAAVASVEYGLVDRGSV